MLGFLADCLLLNLKCKKKDQADYQITFITTVFYTLTATLTFIDLITAIILHMNLHLASSYNKHFFIKNINSQILQVSPALWAAPQDREGKTQMSLTQETGCPGSD